MKITDYITGQDLTSQTLAQVIYEEEKVATRISADVLVKIIRDGLPAS